MKNMLGSNTHTYDFPSAQNYEEKLRGSTESILIKLVLPRTLHRCLHTKAQELLDILLFLMSFRSCRTTEVSDGNSFFIC